MKAFLLIGVLSMAIGASVFARDRVDRREVRQRARIAEGVKSGELTPQEARKLRKEERKVRRMERRAKADGVVTPKEAARLEHAQDKVSEDINEQKHDEESRGE